MNLELGSRFRLPDGRLVEVVPDVEKILKLVHEVGTCYRCEAISSPISDCVAIGCLTEPGTREELAIGYPRILKEVEDE